MLTEDERVKLQTKQDECLIAISDGRKPSISDIVALPPWRAVMVARVAYRAGFMSQDELAGLVDEARVAGPNAKSLRGG